MRTPFVFLLLALFLSAGPATAQDLPPDILADQYLLEAAHALEKGEAVAAQRAFEKLDALETAPPAEFAFYYGKFLIEHRTTLAEIRQGESLLKQFVLGTTKDSEHYKPALALLSLVQAKVEDAEYKAAVAAADANPPAVMGDQANNCNDSWWEKASSEEITRAIENISAQEINRPCPGSNARPIHLALLSKHTSPENLQLLIGKGAKLNVKAGKAKTGFTPLHMSAKNHSNPEIFRMLIKNGADVNARNSNGLTPFHIAAKHQKNTEVFRVLIKAGSDVNAQNRAGFTPLHLAVQYQKNSPQITRVLLEVGADPNAETYDKQSTPLHAFSDSCMDGCSPKIFTMLLNAGANIHARGLAPGSSKGSLGVRDLLEHHRVWVLVRLLDKFENLAPGEKLVCCEEKKRGLFDILLK